MNKCGPKLGQNWAECTGSSAPGNGYPPAQRDAKQKRVNCVQDRALQCLRYKGGWHAYGRLATARAAAMAALDGSGLSCHRSAGKCPSCPRLKWFACV